MRFLPSRRRDAYGLVPWGGPAPSSGSSTIVLPEVIERTDTSLDRSWLVRVFDNDVNTHEEVISILMLATHCTEEEAYIETWEIDHLGQSVVHVAQEDECHEVASVIRRIGIRVEVSQD